MNTLIEIFPKLNVVEVDLNDELWSPFPSELNIFYYLEVLEGSEEEEVEALSSGPNDPLIVPTLSI